jgi:hypothetical protein
MKTIYTLMIMTTLALGSFAFAAQVDKTECEAMNQERTAKEKDGEKRKVDKPSASGAATRS